RWVVRVVRHGATSGAPCIEQTAVQRLPAVAKVASVSRSSGMGTPEGASVANSSSMARMESSPSSCREDSAVTGWVPAYFRNGLRRSGKLLSTADQALSLLVMMGRRGGG